MSWNLIPPSEWIDSEESLAAMGQYLLNSAAENDLSYDTETTGLRIDRDIPVMLSFSDGIRRFAMMAEWLHHPWVKDALLQNREITKVGTNIKFDMHMSANAGVELLGPIQDTLVMSWLHNENRFGHGLKDTARDYCGIKMVNFKEVFPMKKATKNTPAETPGEAILRTLADPEGRAKAIEYSGLDAYATHRVRNYLKGHLLNESLQTGWTLWDYYQSYEMPFTRVLWNCERRGFAICTGHLKGQMGPMEKAMLELEGQLAQMAGWVVNPQSPKQLQKLFFQQLGYEPIKYTDGGQSGIKQPSTDEEVLTQFAAKGCPYSQLIINHRKISKIYGTYIEGLLGWVDSDLRIHTTLRQNGTVTGRLSSSEPNLQNIPRPKGDKFRIREAFIAAPGKRLVVADYDQLEMKLMAHFSEDPRMCQAITEGMDLHCYTVSLMFGVQYEEVFAAKKAKNPTSEQELLLAMRQVAKAIGFGLIYGIGAMKLATQLSEELKREVAKDEAQMNINKYFGVFSGVQAFIKTTHAYCHDTEYVQTLLGRKRRLPQINAKGGGGPSGDDGKGIVAEARRQSVNSIIQGCLPESTRILTDKGYLPIGNAPLVGRVWTGTSWETYQKLDRGPCELANLVLGNGQTLRCDTRHQVLVQRNDGFEFVPFPELEIGDQICLSMASSLEFGERQATRDDFYWLGFATGNGCTRKDGRPAITLTFGDRINRYDMYEKADQFQTYAISRGASPQAPRQHENKISVTVEQPDFQDLWSSLGYDWTTNAKDKRIPSSTWMATLEERRAFLIGLLDADGSISNPVNPNIHMCQKELLEEVQILLRTCGVESRLRGPYQQQDHVSWRLNLNSFQCMKHLDYGQVTKSSISMPAQRDAIRELLQICDTDKLSQSQQVIVSRLRRGGSTSIYNLLEIFSAMGKKPQTLMYATYPLVEKHPLGVTETTYTLSVESPLHRFDSEGVLSKNTAADVAKAAMLRAEHDPVMAQLGAVLLMQIHDELIWEVDDEPHIIASVGKRAKEIMEAPFGDNFQLRVPLTTEAHSGYTWADSK